MKNTGQASINAICPTCGECKLTPSALHMTVYDTGTNGRYTFFCPKCYEQIERSMDIELVKMLKACGVRFTIIAVPAEFKERKPTDDELTVDNLMDLHINLEKTDFLTQGLVEL